VLTPRLDLMTGRFLDAGAAWCVVGRTDRLRARIPLSEADLGSVRLDSEVLLKTVHLPGRGFPGRVARMPAGRTPEQVPPAQMAGVGFTPAAAVSPEPRGSLDVVAAFENPEGLLRPGMQVRVRIYGERLTIAGHAARWAHRLYKGKVWW